MLTDDLVTLAQAQWLKNHGFEQESWPQFVWEKRIGPAVASLLGHRPMSPLWGCRYVAGQYPTSDGWYAAPCIVGDGPGTALGFMEERYGWRWHSHRRTNEDRNWTAMNPDWRKADLEAPTASALLDALRAEVERREAKDAV